MSCVCCYLSSIYSKLSFNRILYCWNLESHVYQKSKKYIIDIWLKWDELTYPYNIGLKLHFAVSQLLTVSLLQILHVSRHHILWWAIHQNLHMSNTEWLKTFNYDGNMAGDRALFIVDSKTFQVVWFWSGKTNIHSRGGHIHIKRHFSSQTIILWRWNGCAGNPRLQGWCGQYGAHLGPGSPRWAPHWPHESCYQG